MAGNYWLYVSHFENRKKNLRQKGAEHIRYIKDIPLYILLPNNDYLPSKGCNEIRKTLFMVSVKNKEAGLDTPLVFKTSNPLTHFSYTERFYLS